MGKQEHPYAQVLRWIADGEDLEWKTYRDEWVHIGREDVFRALAGDPESMSPVGDFRLKPRTIRIGAFDVPEPVREAPVEGGQFWLADPADTELATAFVVRFGDHFAACFTSGLVHRNQADAVLHSRALLSFTSKEQA